MSNERQSYKNAKKIESHGHCRTCGRVSDLTNGLCTDSRPYVPGEQEKSCHERRLALGADEFQKLWDSQLRHIERNCLEIYGKPEDREPKTPSKRKAPRKRRKK